MNKSLVAVAALMAMAGGVQAQSSVTLYGIVDAAVRWSDNEGVGKTNITRMVGGGLSQSRWGFRVDEDLGGGLRAIANMENRFTADEGAIQNGVQWSQAWVGLQSTSFGRVLLGRQYNVLFDIMSTTYSPYKFSTYIETFKPELSIQGQGGTSGLGSRFSNMAKYVVQLGGFTGEAQVSGSEGDANTLKSYGGSGKYVFGPLALGGGYIESESSTKVKAKAYQFGLAYTSGPIYLNYSYGGNKFDAGLAVLAPTNPANSTPVAGVESIFGTSLTFVIPTRGNVAKRELHTLGGTYNITPALLVGGQYYLFKEKTSAGIDNGRADAVSLLVDYAFSKRTDVYVETDYVRLKDGLLVAGTFASPATALATGATKRNSVMTGVRHRF